MQNTTESSRSLLTSLIHGLMEEKDVLISENRGIKEQTKIKETEHKEFLTRLQKELNILNSINKTLKDDKKSLNQDLKRLKMLEKEQKLEVTGKLIENLQWCLKHLAESKQESHCSIGDILGRDPVLRRRDALDDHSDLSERSRIKSKLHEREEFFCKGKLKSVIKSEILHIQPLKLSPSDESKNNRMNEKRQEIKSPDEIYKTVEASSLMTALDRYDENRNIKSHSSISSHNSRKSIKKLQEETNKIPFVQSLKSYKSDVSKCTRKNIEKSQDENFKAVETSPKIRNPFIQSSKSCISHESKSSRTNIERSQDENTKRVGSELLMSTIDGNYENMNSNNRKSIQSSQNRNYDIPHIQSLKSYVSGESRRSQKNNDKRQDENTKRADEASLPIREILGNDGNKNFMSSSSISSYHSRRSIKKPNEKILIESENLLVPKTSVTASINNSKSFSSICSRNNLISIKMGEEKSTDSANCSSSVVASINKNVVNDFLNSFPSDNTKYSRNSTVKSQDKKSIESANSPLIVALNAYSSISSYDSKKSISEPLSITTVNTKSHSSIYSHNSRKSKKKGKKKKLIESVNSPLLEASKSSSPCSQISRKCIIETLVAATIDANDEKSFKSCPCPSDESKFSVKSIENGQSKKSLENENSELFKVSLMTTTDIQGNEAVETSVMTSIDGKNRESIVDSLMTIIDAKNNEAVEISLVTTIINIFEAYKDLMSQSVEKLQDKMTSQEENQNTMSLSFISPKNNFLPLMNNVHNLILGSNNKLDSKVTREDENQNMVTHLSDSPETRKFLVNNTGNLISGSDRKFQEKMTLEDENKISVSLSCKSEKTISLLSNKIDNLISGSNEKIKDKMSSDDDKWTLSSFSSDSPKAITLLINNIDNIRSRKISAHTSYVFELTKVEKSGVMHLISGSNDKSFNIWDLSHLYDENFHPVTQSLCSDIRSITSFNVNKKQYLAIAGETNNDIQVWCLSKKKLHYVLKGHSDGILALSSYEINGDVYVVSGSSDKSIKLWNISTRTCVSTLRGHTNIVRSLVIYEKDSKKFLASGSYDTTVKLWDLNKKSFIKTLKGHSHRIRSVTVFYKDETPYLASGSRDKTVRIWNLSNKKLEESLLGHLNSVLSLATLCMKNICLASGSIDTIKLWDLKNYYLLKTLDITSPAWSLTFYESIDASLLISGHKDGSIVVWSDKL